MYETIKIKKVERSCPACEEYSDENSTNPHKLSRENTVRICLGGTFTKDTGQRKLVRRANKTIAIEGCFISCSSRMMKGVLPGLRPEIVQADTLYEASLPFGVVEINEPYLKRNMLAVTVLKLLALYSFLFCS